MGYQELIESLRNKEKEKLKELQKEAEAEVEKYREEAFQELERYRKEYLSSIKQAADSEVSSLLLQAKKEAGVIRNMAMQRLAERLYRIAGENLIKLRKEDYEEVFAKLSKELPPLKWSSITVNPLDRKLAERYFPEAVIKEDSSITGGLIAESPDGVSVDNTFHKRLERLWPEILPEILREVKLEKEISS